MPLLWSEMVIPADDFDVAALQAALDEAREARGLSWKALADEISRVGERPGPRLISPSTISGLTSKRWGVEGDGVLQILLWLDRTAESFVPEHPGADHPDARLPNPSGGVVRFDARRLHASLDAQRIARGQSWREVSGEVGGLVLTPEALVRLGRAPRLAFPWVMRLTRWLRAPAAAYTRISPW